MNNKSYEINPAELARIAFVAVAAAAVWLRVWEPHSTVSVIGVLGALIGGYPIYKGAVKDIVSRRMTMELSMTLAIVAAFLVGEFFTTLVIIFFVLVAEVIEGVTVDRGRSAIGALMELLPQQVSVRRGERVEEVTVLDLRSDDIVIVRPGARLPVDGIVIAGHSFVDQSAITGESFPTEKIPGSSVFAGTINQSGSLEVRTTALGSDTAFGRIIEAVERAEKSRAPIQKTADRFAGYLVYFAFAAAALTWILTRDIRSTISVIIVTGACGIAAGTPLAIVGAIGRAARLGVIIKGGIHLETLGRVDTIVLDKTGTLTFGNPVVSEIIPALNSNRDEVLAAAAIAESASEHPLGRAIMKKAGELGLSPGRPDHFDYTPGRGISCCSTSSEADRILVGSRAFLEENLIVIGPMAATSAASSEVFVARRDRFIGVIRIADVIRPEAARAVRALRDFGIRTVLLSGDRANIAQAVGDELAVDEVVAELMPDEKLAHVDALLGEKKTVAMLGDGINDAPALARASVGIAMGSGTDVALECADVMLIGNDLVRFVETLAIARQCMNIIRFNFVGTLVVDAVGIVLASAGLLNPLLAAFIHVSSELAFIFNSARLLPSRSRAL